MGVIPTSWSIELVQGSAYDELQNWWDGPGESNPHDFTGEVAVLRIAKDTESAALITLTSVGKTTFPTDGQGIYLSPGVMRIYITAATLAALTEEQFRKHGCDEEYSGENTLFLTTALGVTNVENIGAATFRPVVQP